MDQQVYKVSWTSAEKELDETSSEYTLSELSAQLEGQKVTHFRVEGCIPDNIQELTPELSHLEISYKLDEQDLTSISNLNLIEVLEISDSDLSTSSDVFSGFTSLRELKLCRCQLKSLPDSISNLTSLEVLEISDSDLSTSPDVFSGLTSLKELRLRICQIKSLPTSIFGLASLEILEISDSDFLASSDVFSGLNSLRELKLCRCQLESLPASISSLSKLEILDISENNELTSLPDVFEALKSLRELHASDCQLTQLPQSIETLSVLEVLELGDCDFSNGLPDVMTKLVWLQELELFNCQLKNLPDSFGSLTQLMTLDLSANDFSSDGLPESFSNLECLRILKLNECKLETVPESVKGMRDLIQLWMGGNNFVSIPEFIYDLHNMQILYLSENAKLQSLNPRIANMKNLDMIEVEGCHSLIFPPYETTCKKGLQHIRKYYTTSSEEDLPIIIAVMGYSTAGKTSLIQSLQAGKRELTNRKEETWFDAATKVFEIENVCINRETNLRFLDFGGHEIYHVTYQLTFQDACIPVIVVSIKQYEELKDECGGKEAVRRLMIDWLSQLYLAQSTQYHTKPTIIFTFKDKCEEPFEELKKKFLTTVKDAWGDIANESEKLEKNFLDSLVTFQVDDTEEYFEFEEIKRHLDKLANDKYRRSFQPVEPHILHVTKDVRSLKEKFYARDDIIRHLTTSYSRLGDIDFDEALRHLHRCGRLLWYENEETLKDYVFLDIAAVRKLLIALFDHDENETWKKRIENFKSFLGMDGHYVEKEMYEDLIKAFQETGIIDRTLLYQILGETDFKLDKEMTMALNLLTSFKLLYHPEEHPNIGYLIPCHPEEHVSIGYLIPNFSRGCVESRPERSFEIRLHLEIQFKGLYLPLYAYHQMTVDLLEVYAGRETTFDVKFNGVFIHRPHTTIGFIHDAKSRTATIQLAGGLGQIHLCWSQLREVSQTVIKQTSERLKAADFDTFFYCPHCIIKGEIPVVKDQDPEWSKTSPDDDAMKHSNEAKLIICRGDQVPAVLKQPCSRISSHAVKTIRKRIAAWQKAQKSAPLPASGQDGEKSPQQDGEPLAEHQQQELNEEESDISDDGEGFLYPTNENEKEKTLRLRPTKMTKVKELYYNRDVAYKMSSPIRGIALIINNKTFDGGQLSERTASDVDVRHLKALFTEMKFEVEVQTDITAERMITAIREATYDPRNEDFGMFILYIMSHAAGSDSIYGADVRAIQLENLYQLISAEKFPVMKGKPKLVFIQACTNGLCSNVKQADLSEEKIETSAEDIDLRVDNMVLIQSRCQSRYPVEDPSLGSLFVRCLVTTFYKHSSHRDIKRLADTVQKRVEDLSSQLTGNRDRNSVHFHSSLTSSRQLYLFPGYNGSRKTWHVSDKDC